jgi:chaperonin GroES
MNIRPIGARVLVKPLPADNVTSGGIYIPDAAQKKSLRGEVVGVGKGTVVGSDETVTLWSGVDVEIGDKVIYGDFVGDEIEIDGVKHQLLHEEHILGVIED